MPNMAFGRLLRERRRARDLTQEKLAELVGCAVVTLKKIEAGSLRPSRQIAERLAEVLDVPQDERAPFVDLARGVATPPATPSDAHTEIAAETPQTRMVRGYELRERIGAGGFGVVYRAVQSAVGRDVAIKAIHPQYADQPAFIRRFEVEAQLVARLEHPHIVPLYDYWREPGSAYLVMRYLRGGSLSDALQRGLWALPAVARLIDQIGAALHAAHRQGIVHRDVKPANILLDPEGNAYLADFGIAKDLDQTHAGDTHPGAVIGSPEYLSPEQLRGEPVTLQTDVYSLGLVLYELLTGVNPFASLSPAERLHRQIHEPLPSLRVLRPNMADLFDPIIARATAKHAADRYPNLPSFVADMQRLPGVDAPSFLQSDAPAIDIPSNTLSPWQEYVSLALTSAVEQIRENPYKGLRAFQSSDAATFFGREALTQRLLARLAELPSDNLSTSVDPEQAYNATRFLAVIGPSGSGKSSAVLAGLLPALRRGDLPGSEHWFIAEAVPGSYPLEEIEAALLRVAVNPPPSLLEQLRADERGLMRSAKRALPADERVELVLVLDQFEEVFTLVEREDDRAHLLRSLVVAVSEPRSRLRLVVTLRADFFDKPLLYEGFSELMRLRTEVITPLTTDELRTAIVKPAEHAGVMVEPELIDTIVRDVASQPGALPLVQYALTELFEQRHEGTMTLSRYNAMGGIAGALARRADALFTALDAEGKAVARQLFLRLVTPGEGLEDTRRRVRRAEFMAGEDHNARAEIVLDAYGRYRLFTFDKEPHTGEPTVEVAHEALIREWDQLRRWLDESRAILIALRRLASAATEWKQGNHDASFLASGGRLAQFEEVRSADAIMLNAEESAYLDASVKERLRQEQVEAVRQEHELRLQQRARARLRWLVIGLTIFLVIALALSVFAFNRQTAAVAGLQRSEALRLAAEAKRLVQTNGNSEVIAPLSIRSLKLGYTTQGDAVLLDAAQLPYAQQILRGHSEPIWSVAFSPDGTKILTGSWDKTARLWNRATGVEIRQFVGHTDQVWDVAFSPDGKYILTASSDQTARLWDSETGVEVRQFIGHTSSVVSVAFSPDGRYVLTSGDQTVRLWDSQSGVEIRQFVGHAGAVEDAVFSPDGNFVLTGSDDQTARLWDVQTGAERKVFSGHTGRLIRVAFSSDGKHIASASEDRSVRLWNVQSGQEEQRLIGHIDTIRDVSFSPDGMQVLTASQDRTARLWDVGTGTERRVYTGHTDFITAVAFSPDGASIVTASSDATARVWDIRSVAVIPQFTGHTGVFAQERPIIITDGNGIEAQISDIQTGAIVQRLRGFESPIGSVSISPDGKEALTGHTDGSILVWNVADGKIMHTLNGHSMSIFSITFSSDGKYILSSSVDATARLWDRATGTFIRSFTGHTGQLFSSVFAPDGAQVLTSSIDGSVRLWDTNSGQQIKSFTTPPGPTSVAFTPDDKAILIGGADGRVRLIDRVTGTEVRSLVGHTTFLFALAVSPDGKTVLTGSADGTARLWDFNSGEEIRRYTEGADPVVAAAYAPDGKRVLTGNARGVVRVWDTTYRATMLKLCGLLVRDLTDEERGQYGITDATPTCAPQTKP